MRGDNLVVLVGKCYILCTHGAFSPFAFFGSCVHYCSCVILLEALRWCTVGLSLRVAASARFSVVYGIEVGEWVDGWIDGIQSNSCDGEPG